MDCREQEIIWGKLKTLKLQIDHLLDPYQPYSLIPSNLKEEIMEDKIKDIIDKINEILQIGGEHIKEESLKKLGMMKKGAVNIKQKERKEKIIKILQDLLLQLEISFQENIIFCRSRSRRLFSRTY